MDSKLKVNQILLSICACWASINGELGLPLNNQLQLLDSVTLVWSILIMCTTSVKFLAKDLPLNLTRATNYRKDSEPTVHDLLTINYLPRINEFEKLYYGLVCVSIGTSLCWRIYLRFFRPEPQTNYQAAAAAEDVKEGLQEANPRPDYSGDAMHSLVRFLYWGPPQPKPRSRSRSTIVAQPALIVSMAKPQVHNEAAHLEWVKLFECRAAIRDLAAGSREIVQPIRLHGNDAASVQQLRRCSRVFVNATRQVRAPKAGFNNQAQEEQDIFMNPVRNYNFLKDHTWKRWQHVERNVLIVLVFMLAATLPIMYYTITGLYSVMLYFSFETLDTRIKLLLYCYGVAEQVYACSQAALFFIFTNLFITIFHADIEYKINTIERELRDMNKIFKRNDKPCPQQQRQQHHEKTGYLRRRSVSVGAKASEQEADFTRPPKILVYYQQLRLWAFFDYINQMDNFMSRYSIVSMSTFMIGLSFGQSFLKVEEPALKRGTAAVMIANFLSFTFLYVISWDIERRSNRLHSLLMSMASRDCDFLIKRLWLKTFFGFFERDCHRTFSLAGKYPLNLDFYLKTMFGWITISLLINKLFHKPAWGLLK